MFAGFLAVADGEVACRVDRLLGKPRARLGAFVVLPRLVTAVARYRILARKLRFVRGLYAQIVCHVSGVVAAGARIVRPLAPTARNGLDNASPAFAARRRNESLGGSHAAHR